MQHFSDNQTDLTQRERSRRKGTPSQNFFVWESCAAPAAGRRNPLPCRPLPRGRRDAGGWFWDFDRGRGRVPSFLGVFPTADKTRRTRPGTEETAANCMKSALKRSIFLCYAVKTLEISAFHCKIKRKRIKTKRKRREIMRFTPFFNKSAVFSCVRRCFPSFWRNFVKGLDNIYI